MTELGVNDTVAPGTETTPGYARYTKKIEWFMSLFPPTTPVIWTNLPCNLLPPPRLTGCTNHQLRTHRREGANPQSDRRRLEPRVVRPHRVNMVAPGSDVHLSPAGQNAWTSQVLSILDAKIPG